MGEDAPEEQEMNSGAREAPITRIVIRVIFIILSALLHLFSGTHSVEDLQLISLHFLMRYRVKIL